jgi:hypothetical protein
MSRIAARVLTVCLLLLPTAAFAGSVYNTRANDFDLYVNTITGTSLGANPDNNGSALTYWGYVDNVRDVAGTACAGECTVAPILNMIFTVTSTGFTVEGLGVLADDSAITPVSYLTGTVVPGSYTQQLKSWSSGWRIWGAVQCDNREYS